MFIPLDIVFSVVDAKRRFEKSVSFIISSICLGFGALFWLCVLLDPVEVPAFDPSGIIKVFDIRIFLMNMFSIISLIFYLVFWF